MDNTNTAVQVQAAPVNNANPVVEKNLIEEALILIDAADLNVLESAKQIEDINQRRNAIADHLIDVAKTLNLMKKVKSPSTMREKIYNILAIKTTDSKKLYTKLGMTVDVLDTLANKDALIEATGWKIK